MAYTIVYNSSFNNAVVTENHLLYFSNVIIKATIIESSSEADHWLQNK